MFELFENKKTKQILPVGKQLEKKSRNKKKTNLDSK